MQRLLAGRGGRGKQHLQENAVFLLDVSWQATKCYMDAMLFWLVFFQIKTPLSAQTKTTPF